MVSVPLGLAAYKRQYIGAPEVRLVNRYLEVSPTNLKEHVALISRPGTTSLVNLTSGRIRANFSKVGLFNGDLFSVAANSFYRFDGSSLIPITGVLQGDGYVYSTWMKGIGYEFQFISDGYTLQYYTTHAMGVLTLSGGSITSQVIEIGGTYYSWSANVNTGTPDGTSGTPYLALLGTATPDANGLTGDASSLANMAALLNFSGSGSQYSSTVPGANPDVTATALTTVFGSTLTLTAIADLSTGNTVTTSIFSGSHLAWTSTTLTGGGNQALQTVTGMGDGEVPKGLTNVSGYVLVSVAYSQKFYWLNPGETVIDPLNFAEKESNPDNISEMVTVGDQAIICGDGSTENWYATGNFDAPFAPVEGRVYKRGVLEGTAVVVKDSVIVVGDDGIVYSIGYATGDTAQFGVHRISNHGIEERIRTQIRSLQSLSP